MRPMRVNLLRYAGVYIAAAIGLAALTWAAAALLGVRLPTGLSTALPPMLAAMIEGQALARAARAPIPGGDAWREAGRMTLVVALLNAVILAGVLTFTPELANAQAASIIGLVFLVLLGVVFLVNRFFLGLGARSQLKSMEASR